MKCVPEIAIERRSTHLKKECAPHFPTHLLGSFADDLIHGRFDKRCRDRLSVAISVTIVGDRLLIDFDVVTEFLHGG
jgi:hypothetical protein